MARTEKGGVDEYPTRAASYVCRIWFKWHSCSRIGSPFSWRVTCSDTRELPTVAMQKGMR
jgi:hypothetical protein